MKHHHIFPIILIFLASNICAQKTAKDFFIKAHEKASLSNTEEAIELFSKAIELDPLLTVAYIDRGSLRFSIRDYNGAAADFTEALKLKPDYAEIYYMRGNSLFIVMELDSACNDYKAADKLGFKKATEKIVLACKDSGSLTPVKIFNRANAKFNEQSFQKALADYSQAIQLKPNFINAYIMRGLVKDEIKDYMGAVADFNKAIELNPKNAEAYINRALSKSNLNDQSGACNDLKKAVELGYEKGKELMIRICK